MASPRPQASVQPLILLPPLLIVHIPVFESHAGLESPNILALGPILDPYRPSPFLGKVH